MRPFTAMMASNKLQNVAWTAPLLIGGGLYLQSKIGGLMTHKLFALNLAACYMLTCAAGPNTEVGKLSLRRFMPQMLKNFDCIDDRTGNMVGADMLAVSVLYSILFYHRLYAVGAAVACFD